MTGIETGLAIGVPVVSAVGAFLVSWGYYKGKQELFLTHPQHRDLCAKVSEGESEKRENIYGTMRDGFKEQGLKMDELIRAVGKIEGMLTKKT